MQEIQGTFKDQISISQGNSFTGAIESGWRKFCKENGLEGEEPRFTDKILEPLLREVCPTEHKNQFGGRVRVSRFREEPQSALK